MPRQRDEGRREGQVHEFICNRARVDSALIIQRVDRPALTARLRSRNHGCDTEGRGGGGESA